MSASSQPTPGLSGTSGPLRPVFITGGLRLGGSTTLLINLCAELVRRGVEHQVLCLEPEDPMRADFEAAGIPLSHVDRRPRIAEDVIAWARECCRAFRPSHAIAWLAPTSCEVLRYIPAGIPKLAVAHSDEPLVYDALAWYGKILDGAIGVSQALCANIRKTPGLTHLPVHYQPCGIPIPHAVARGESHPPPGASGNTEKPIRILYLGRLGNTQKRVHLFPAIYRDLCASGRPFHWTIAGDGPDRDALHRDLPPSPPPQSVEYTGPLAYSQVPAFLASHDLFLLASSYEGLPVSLLEAMAQGLVPVVSDLRSGIGEVVDSSTGMLIPPDEVHQYAQGILALESDRPRLHAMSGRCREAVITRFSSAAMAGRWLEMLHGFSTDPAARWETAPIRPFLPLQSRLLYASCFRPLRRLLANLRTGRF